MAVAIGRLGGQIICASHRECMTYQSPHFHQASTLVLSLVSDTVLNSAFLVEELEIQRGVARRTIRETNYASGVVLADILHEVACGRKGLGSPLTRPVDRISLITGDLRHCILDCYRPERMVVAGTGKPQENWLNLSTSFFRRSTPGHRLRHPRHRSYHHISCHLRDHQQTSHQQIRHRHLHTQPLLQATHPLYSTSSHIMLVVSVTSQFVTQNLITSSSDSSVGFNDDDISTLSTIKVLLGGGEEFFKGKAHINPAICFSPFSGGPGHGIMFSRLYTQVVYHISQVNYGRCYHSIYTDSSLFGVWATFESDI